MLKYTIKRLLQCLLTVFIIVTIVFLLIRMLPTDYYFTEEQLIKFTEQQKHDQLLAAGFLDPIPTQLFKFYNQLAHFDFGTSRRIQSGVPVVKIIASRFAVSMRIGITAVLVALVIGIFIGITQVRHKNGILDHLGTAYTIFVNAVPPLVSYALMLVFGSRVLGFPAIYSTRNPGPSSILPITCLALLNIAWWALWTRRYMIDEVNKDYIKLARIKGMSNKSIMFKHVLRNAFVPLAQYLPMALIGTISGSLLVERFFSVPGMGPLLADAVNRYDTTIVQVLVMLYSSMGVIGIFLGDLMMMLVDPRITLARKGGAR